MYVMTSVRCRLKQEVVQPPWLENGCSSVASPARVIEVFRPLLQVHSVSKVLVVVVVGVVYYYGITTGGANGAEFR